MNRWFSGSKLGLDATRKIAGETSREWPRPARPDPAVERRVEALCARILKQPG